MCLEKCAGSRWFCLYFDDVSDICFSGTEYGFWCSFSIYKGKGSDRELRLSVVHAFGLIMGVTVLLNVLVYLFTDPILWFLRVPEEVYDGMKTYLLVIFAGLVATSLYNFFLPFKGSW